MNQHERRERLMLLLFAMALYALVIWLLMDGGVVGGAVRITYGLFSAWCAIT